MRGYLIDKLAADVLEATVKAIVKGKKKIKKPISSIVLWYDSAESFIPQQLLINFRSGKPFGYFYADLKLDLDIPRTRVPYSVYSVEGKGDPVKDAFIQEYKIKSKSEWWAERLATPRILVRIEINLGLAPLLSVLKGRNIPVSRTCAIYNGDPDGVEIIQKKQNFDRAIQRDLKRKLKTATQRKAFAELCYSDLRKQEWLLTVMGRK
jgi:hypothetical protein